MILYTVREMIQSLLSNDQALVTVITIILVNTSLFTTSDLIIYYFTYIIGDGTDAYSMFGAFGGASQILAMIAFPVFRKMAVEKRVWSFQCRYL